MKYISLLILIIFLFLITISANAFWKDSSSTEIKTVDSIYSINVVHQDCICTQSAETYILTNQRNDGIFVNGRKTDTSFDNSTNGIFSENTEQFENLLSYLYNQSFLHNKSKVHFSVSLSEIQPNAP